jgi:predicted O-methyltransferase YrrM
MPTYTGDALLTLARNFMECRILLTGAELDLFSLLAPAPLTAAQVTQRVHGDERALTILLDALAAMELLSKRDGQYRCEPQIAALLAADAPQGVLPMVLHSASLWQRWTELTGIARGDAAARTRARAPRDDAAMRAFIGAMHVVSAPQAETIARAIQPGPARRLLDVGAGPGTYTIALLRQAPQMQATIFDQPAVVEMARANLAAVGMAERATLVGGDFYKDELPGGHDLALLSAIIHQNSHRQNIDLYRKIHRALVPGGRLVIRDHIQSPDRTQPRGGAVFAINMLVGTEGGNCYTLAEYEEALVAAGYERVRQLQADQRMDGLVEAYKPG